MNPVLYMKEDRIVKEGNQNLFLYSLNVDIKTQMTQKFRILKVVKLAKFKK